MRGCLCLQALEPASCWGVTGSCLPPSNSLHIPLLPSSAPSQADGGRLGTARGGLCGPTRPQLCVRALTAFLNWTASSFSNEGTTRKWSHMARAKGKWRRPQRLEKPAPPSACTDNPHTSIHSGHCIGTLCCMALRTATSRAAWS